LKAGPILSSESLPSGFKVLFANLANNHISDFGESGIDSTIQKLEQLGILYSGVWTHLNQTLSSQFINVDGISVAIISLSETQFGDLETNGFGYRTIGPWLFKEISECKLKSERIIVSIHGGLENSSFPSLDRRNLYRSLVDSGVDLIYGHHPHKPQGWEFYGDGLICYGLGNFATNPQLISHDDLVNYSLVVDIDLNNIKKSKFRIAKQKMNENNQIVVNIADLGDSIWSKYFTVVNRITNDDDSLMYAWKQDATIAFNKFHRLYLPGQLRPIELIRFIIMKIFSKLKSRKMNSPFDKLMTLVDYHLHSNETNIEVIKEVLKPASQICEESVNSDHLLVAAIIDEIKRYE
jgi:hypothetical protein